MNLITLEGCTSEPLSSYLVALAVLRLVSEQRDPEAKGWWKNGVFHLESRLDKTSITKFFLDEYVPSPIVSPWNGGSGFYEGDNTEGIGAIVNSTSKRFAVYRETIERIRAFPEMPPTGLSLEDMLSILESEAKGKTGSSWGKTLDLVDETRSKACLVAPIISPDDPLGLTIEQLNENTKLPRKASKAEKDNATMIKDLLKPAKKVRTKVKQLKRGAGKDQIILACRDRLDESAVEWVDAAAVIGPDGETDLPPILGTGGNEGRFEYTNAFMKNLAGMLLSDDREQSSDLLKNALFGDHTDQLLIASVGQYDPGRAGGFNQGQGIENKDFPANPWSFVLAIEGSVVWASSVARRQGATTKGFMRSPFTVRASPVGYASSSDKDGQNARAEIWAPLWKNPASYREIRAFLSEGRADVGRKMAASGIEFAEAASSLGVDRGISEFVRYSLLKRRGESYVALPTGRFSVKARSKSDLVRELHPLLRRTDWFLRGFKGQGPPARFVSARRGIDSAIYDLLLHGGAVHVKYLIAAIGKMEQLLAQRGPLGDPKLRSPISGLSSKWLLEADDGSVEVRIAAALASIRDTGKVGPIRANLAPVDPEMPWAWVNGHGQMAWTGNSLSTRLASVLARRMMDADRLDTKYNPLWGEIWLSDQDVAAFIEGDVDEHLIQDLLFGFTWIKWGDKDAVKEVRKKLGWERPVTERVVPRSWILLKLLFLPGKIELDKNKISIRSEPSIVPLLNAGHIRDACKVAERRLISSELVPIASDFPDGDDGIRIAAALILPVRDKQKMTKKVLVSKPEK